ncbi:ion channel [Natranaerovirga pectinivora]|uniref:Ion channel n=1 Tax=Natranaerovirga pectinivora TaxID=682400 RepID=A0A4V2V068_9FIRM|nr:ion channel [Natranaerovirga pectinivora]TCT14298.1 ion channel [Natranaerovirga pectinivora]
MNRKSIIIYNVVILCLLYLLIGFIFCFIYILLHYLGLGSIMDTYASPLHQQQNIDLFTRTLYFSFITQFAVGYGDMIPLGLAKGVAIFQALIGYVLPYAMVLNYIIIHPNTLRGFKKK